jgi:hypothetical protein
MSHKFFHLKNILKHISQFLNREKQRKVEPFKLFFIIYSYVYTLFGPLLSSAALLPSRTCFALFFNFVEQKT